ncbi:MAG: CopG family transcriptional regulator [Gemmatimonadota bacterium]
MARTVREPIQVYLTAAEREVLDRCAAELGVSRSEILRRGLRAVGEPEARPSVPPTLHALLKPAATGPGDPPPSLPVAPLEDLLEELARDRGGR